MSVLLEFAVALFCGLFAAQFAMQALTSTIVLLLSLAGFLVSKVQKRYSGLQALAALCQAALFAVLTYAVLWTATQFLDLTELNLASIVLLIAAAVTILFMAFRIPGKVLLARRTAWDVGFREAMMASPRAQRVSLARSWRKQ